MDNLSTDNSIAMWKLGRTHGCEELEERAWPLILDNFVNLSQTEDFCVELEVTLGPGKRRRFLSGSWVCVGCVLGE